MKQLWACLCVIGLWVGGVAWAQLPQIEDYRGDFWSRPALTGDWGGLRTTLAQKGITLDVDLLQSVQGLNTGGSFRNQDSLRYPYGGYAEYLLNIDTGKLGLWPGGFLRILGESQFGAYQERREELAMRCCRGSRPTAPATDADEMRRARTVITRRGDDQRYQ